MDFIVASIAEFLNIRALGGSAGEAFNGSGLAFAMEAGHYGIKKK